MHGVAGLCERVGDEAKLNRRAAEAMHQQDAEPPTTDVLATVGNLPGVFAVIPLTWPLTWPLT